MYFINTLDVSTHVVHECNYIIKIVMLKVLNMLEFMFLYKLFLVI